MNILLAPDKFKGNLDSFALCNAMKEGVLEADATATTCLLPMADGGDGFSAVLAHYQNTTTVHCDTTDPLGKPITVTFEWDETSGTAIIEMAAASGLALLQTAERNPLITSTTGTGILIAAALNKGAKTILLGIGGSATNDGGTGILHSLGYRFYDAANNELFPCGQSLQSIVTITKPASQIEASIVIACDVSNTLTGSGGCAYTYAAQKGATNLQIELLEKGMQNFAGLLQKETGKNLNTIPGSGAAGGTAAGLILLPNTTMAKGIDIIFKHSSFYEHLAKADLVITAEGAFDKQTLNEKLVYAVAQAAKLACKPVMAVCGKLDADAKTINACGLNYITSICNRPMSPEESYADAWQLTKTATTNLVTLFASLKKQTPEL